MRCVQNLAQLVAVSDMAFAGEMMPGAQQNAIVEKYCAVCHTDATMNGGVSLQHFDAATAAASLKAMMLSKVTQGALLQTVRQAGGKAAAEEFMEKRLRGGAMAASGAAEPDMATMKAFAYALAEGSTRASEWTVERNEAGATASILREAPPAKSQESAESYRVILACNATTRQGTMQVAWSPIPKLGKLLVAVDAQEPASYAVEGKEKMGNGVGSSTGLAAIYITGLALPEKSLTVSNLFPDDVVTFPFASLPAGARKGLAPCFSR